jgi:hypothetical protein
MKRMRILKMKNLKMLRGLKVVQRNPVKGVKLEPYLRTHMTQKRMKISMRKKAQMMAVATQMMKKKEMTMMRWTWTMKLIKKNLLI